MGVFDKEPSELERLLKGKRWRFPSREIEVGGLTPGRLSGITTDHRRLATGKVLVVSKKSRAAIALICGDGAKCLMLCDVDGAPRPADVVNKLRLDDADGRLGTASWDGIRITITWD